jgi:hypothetical protein
MIIQRIEQCTRTLGKSQGYLGLPIRDVIIHDKTSGQMIQAMQSTWEPTPNELENLNKGARVILTIVGTGHPPVMLDVSDPPPIVDQEAFDVSN